MMKLIKRGAFNLHCGQKPGNKKEENLKLAVNCGCDCLTKLIITANISSHFQANLSVVVEQLNPPSAIWHPPSPHTFSQEDGWTLAALTEVNGFPSHVS